MKKIKVAILIDEFFGAANTAYGGYGFLARNYLTKYIPNEDIQMDVLLEMKDELNETELIIVDSLNVYRLPGNEIKALTWLQEQEYDLFFSIEMTYPSYQIYKLIDKSKLLLWIQDPRPETYWEKRRNSVSLIKDPCVCDSSASNLVNLRYCEGLVSFITQGYSLIKLAKELYSLPINTQISYIPNPIEIDQNFQFDLNKKKKQIVFVGRLEAQKRAWLVCETAKLLPQYDFYIMGKFTRHENENKNSLAPYMDNSIKNLHFTGHLEGEDKFRLIRESRLLINTSIWEGIPISWLEAMQFGTLIVSCLNNENIPSKYGAYVGDIIGNGFSSVKQFVPHIIELMENDSKYKEKAISSIEYIHKYHNIERFTENVRNKIYEEIDRKIICKSNLFMVTGSKQYSFCKNCNHKCYINKVANVLYKLKNLFK